MKAITLFNTPIRVDESGMICLTDMWKASGKSESESPYHYLRNKQTKEFLAELEKNHESVVFTERGAQASFFLHYGSTSKQPKPVSGEITLAATER